ncbi:hydrogenase formation protein HypD [Halobacteriovorax sp. GFR7]|uniref:hydrogenase formation protein HypD n=1 Tax=unclassified Halobacteriovorax TaxID=2639665 RepID=UPI003D99DADD
MKYQKEFRQSSRLKNCLEKIQKVTTRPWRIMEVCGGQTNTIMRYGLDQLVKPIEFVHGPGCPVCVTPIHIIDMALELAKSEEVIFTSFGDMLRVPGSHENLLSIKAKGAKVQMVYSPLEAVDLAERNRDKQVVFFAIGFETTAPLNALSVLEAKRRNLKNFSILVSQVLVPPAVKTLFSDPQIHVDALIAAGHVCTIKGESEYIPLIQQFQKPIVITGFEPLDLLDGLYHCIQQLEKGQYKLENQYRRSVRPQGNPIAQKAVDQIFEVADINWRGLGNIEKSGLRLKREYREFDAYERFKLNASSQEVCNECQSGDILKGLIKPPQCPAFGKACTPLNPLGAPMVSEEGACQAYYRFKRRDQ